MTDSVTQSLVGSFYSHLYDVASGARFRGSYAGVKSGPVNVNHIPFPDPPEPSGAPCPGTGRNQCLICHSSSPTLST